MIDLQKLYKSATTNLDIQAFLLFFLLFKGFTVIQNDETISFFEMGNDFDLKCGGKAEKNIMGVTTPSTNLKGFSPDFLRLGGRFCHGSFLWCSSPWFGWDHEISPGRQGAWPGELLLLVLRILFEIVYNYFECKHIYQTKWYGYVSIQKQDVVMDALEFTISYKNYLKVLSSFVMLINLPLEMERHQHHFFMEQELFSPGPAMWQLKTLFNRSTFSLRGS